jgi:hypothetical protein
LPTLTENALFSVLPTISSLPHCFYVFHGRLLLGLVFVRLHTRQHHHHHRQFPFRLPTFRRPSPAICSLSCTSWPAHLSRDIPGAESYRTEILLPDVGKQRVKRVRACLVLFRHRELRLGCVATLPGHALQRLRPIYPLTRRSGRTAPSIVSGIFGVLNIPFQIQIRSFSSNRHKTSEASLQSHCDPKGHCSAVPGNSQTCAGRGFGKQCVFPPFGGKCQ